MISNVVFTNSDQTTSPSSNKKTFVIFPTLNPSFVNIPNLILLGFIILIISCLVISLASVVSAWTHFSTLVNLFLFELFQYLRGPRWKFFNGNINNHYGFIKSVQKGAEPTNLKKEAENLLYSSSMIFLSPLRGKILFYFISYIFFPLLLGLEELNRALIG